MKVYPNRYVQRTHGQIITIALLYARMLQITVNPPYMGASGMGEKLSKLVTDNYPDSKSDLFAVFIEKCGEYLKETGYQAMITQHAWMFLSSFEKLRGKLQQHELVNMAHLGARAFEEIGGEVVQTTAFVLQNRHIAGYAGSYARLIEPTTQQGKEDMFLAEENRYTAQQENFTKIPGMPVAYWLNDNIYLQYRRGELLSKWICSQVGTTLGDNERFMRLWFEVASGYGTKWFFSHKGGAFRRWYGNVVHVINWENQGAEVKSTGRATVRGEKNAFNEGISWTQLTAGFPSFRIKAEGTFIESASCMCTVDSDKYYYLLAYLNCALSAEILDAMNPTMHFQPGDIGRLPWDGLLCHKEEVETCARNSVNLSHMDWDSFEISWDFEHHPLI